MNVNTNKWNRIRYTLYTPVYDVIGRLFSRLRKQSIEQLNIKAGDRVLLVGAGTGLDLDFIHKSAIVVATDITPSMVERMKRRSEKLNLAVNAQVMDGHQLQFENESFDKVILHLILAVIPDPIKCMKEVERVLKPGGEVAVFDKFLLPGKKSSFIRNLANYITKPLFTDINRNFEVIIVGTSLSVVNDVRVGPGGNFRIIKLIKKGGVHDNRV